MRPKAAPTLILCVVVASPAAIGRAQVPQARARASGPAPGSVMPAEPRALPPRLEWVRGRPPIAFQPFDTLDARGRRLPLDSVITLRFPSGHTSGSMMLRDLHFFANQLESAVNAHGVSLRRLDTSAVLLRPRTDAALLRRQRQRFEAVPRLTLPADLGSAAGRMQRLETRTAAPVAQLAQVDPRMARLAATPGPKRARPVAGRAIGASPSADAAVDRFAETTQSATVADTTWRWDESYGDFGASVSVGAGVTLVSSLDDVQIAFSYNAGAAFLDASVPLVSIDAEFLAGRDGVPAATVTWSLLGNPGRTDEPIQPRPTMEGPGRVTDPQFYHWEDTTTSSGFTIDVPLIPVSVELSLSVNAGFDAFMTTTEGQPALTGYVAPHATARLDAAVGLSLDFPPVEVGAEGYLVLVATQLRADVENVVRTSGAPGCAAGAPCGMFDYGAFRLINVAAELRSLQGGIAFYLDVPVPCMGLPPWCWERLVTLDFSWDPLDWRRLPLFLLDDVATVAENVPLRVIPRMQSSQAGRVLQPAPRP